MTERPESAEKALAAPAEPEPPELRGDAEAEVLAESDLRWLDHIASMAECANGYGGWVTPTRARRLAARLRAPRSEGGGMHTAQEIHFRAPGAIPGGIPTRPAAPPSPATGASDV